MYINYDKQLLVTVRGPSMVPKSKSRDGYKHRTKKKKKQPISLSRKTSIVLGVYFKSVELTLLPTIRPNLFNAVININISVKSSTHHISICPRYNIKNIIREQCRAAER